jgi:hypothetical protein
MGPTDFLDIKICIKVLKKRDNLALELELKTVFFGYKVIG